MNIASYIREFEGFPKPGILFKDISPILKDPKALQHVVDSFAKYYRDHPIDVIAGLESRGLIFAAALALKLNKSFIMIRKENKLPGPTERMGYDIEYGNAIMEVQADAIKPGEHVLIIDDLLATGGTAQAAAELVQRLGGQVAGFSFIVELLKLNGRSKLSNYNIQTLVTYDL